MIQLLDDAQTSSSLLNLFLAHMHISHNGECETVYVPNTPSSTKTEVCTLLVNIQPSKNRPNAQSLYESILEKRDAIFYQHIF